MKTEQKIVAVGAASGVVARALVFAIASLALSTIVPLRYLQVVWACVIDAYLNPGMILYVLFHAFVR